MPLRFAWAVVCAFVAISAQAQWVNYPAVGLPRLPDGRPDLSAPPPRLPDGKPDLSGVWTTDPTPPDEMKRLFPFLFLSNTPVPGDDPRFFPKYFLNIFADFRPEDVPMRPEAAQLFKQRAAALSRDTPTARCLPQGVPWGDLLPVPRRFIHQPHLLVVLYEGRNPPRLIYLDGRPHPEDPQPAWLGYAVGRWESETLLVETRGFNDKGWLDAIGHPRSEQMRLTERFRRPSLGRIEVEATIDDAGAYTKPFSIRYTQTLTPDTDLIEMICTENERDSSGTVGQR